MKFAMPFLILVAVLLSTNSYAQKRNGNWRLFGGGKDTEEPKNAHADSVVAAILDSIAAAQAAQEAEAIMKEGHMAAPDTSSAGVAEIFQDYRIRQLLDKQIRINDSTGTITGFRVQLWFGSGAGSATKAKEVESEFLGMHPTVPTYRHYEKSAFRLKAGNFRTRMQAQKFHESIREYFPSAFIIRESDCPAETAGLGPAPFWQQPTTFLSALQVPPFWKLLHKCHSLGTLPGSGPSATQRIQAPCRSMRLA